jgi:hypothetical protein
MLKHLIFILPIIFLIFLNSCKERFSIQGFNEQAWKSDFLACNSDRSVLIKIIQQEKNQILGLSENNILQLFGKPDFQELIERNQKYYYYYYQPGQQCEGRPLGSKDHTLQLRFTALGYANEIVINE